MSVIGRFSIMLLGRMTGHPEVIRVKGTNWKSKLDVHRSPG